MKHQISAGRGPLLARTALTASLVGLCVGMSVSAEAAVTTEGNTVRQAAPSLRLAQTSGTTESEPAAETAPAAEGEAAESPEAGAAESAPATGEAEAPAAPAAPPATTAEEPAAPAAPATAAEQPAAPAVEGEAPAATAETPAEPAAPAAPDAPEPKAVEVATPEDPVAKKAFAVLEKHCARCHQEGKLKRARPAKNFGNVLKLEEIARDANLIQPGNPDASRIFSQIVKKEMPYDVYYEFSGDSPTPEDLAALREWITVLGTQAAGACTNRKSIHNEAMVEEIAADLEATPEVRRKGMRYISLANLYSSCATEEDMTVYRQAVVKLLNSLSTSPQVLKLETIDEAKSIIKFHLDDLGWKPDTWEKLLAVYPYAVQPDVDRFSFLKETTGTALPYFRGDWMAFAASRPPLYHDVLGLPDKFDALLKEVELDVDKNIEQMVAKRSGFQKSGVSRNNRLIERHAISTGAFWTSYDFAGNQGKQSLFEHPLGPKGDNAFTHDGGESIWTLPNGFSAYYLTTSKGDRLNVGPTNIVQDTNQKDLSVTNGISCMGCHDQGFRKAKDEIRAHVAKDRTFSKEVRDTIEVLYPTPEEMDAIIDEDVKNFRSSLEKAGIDPDLKSGGVEIINALSKQYEKDVNIKLAAAELGLDEKEFVDRLEGASGETFRLKRRLMQGVVPRDTFEVSFKTLLKDATDDTFIETKVAGAAEAPVGKKAADANVSRDFELALFSDRSDYAQKDLATFSVTSKKDCYLTLINIDPKGLATVIFPNDYQKDNFLAAGKEVQLPGEKAGFQFRLKDKGTETVIAACNASDAIVDGIKHDFDKQQFTDLGNYEEFVTRSIERSIAVEQSKGVKKGKKASEEVAEGGKITAKGDVLARTAIKFEVK